MLLISSVFLNQVFLPHGNTSKIVSGVQVWLVGEQTIWSKFWPCGPVPKCIKQAEKVKIHYNDSFLWSLSVQLFMRSEVRVWYWFTLLLTQQWKPGDVFIVCFSESSPSFATTASWKSFVWPDNCDKLCFGEDYSVLLCTSSTFTPSSTHL